MDDYKDFLKGKRIVVKSTGPKIKKTAINKKLFPFQRDITKWSVRKGRAAIFADTGLGKTVMQVEWARLIGGKSLIIAPLSVAKQTIKEAKKLLGIDVLYSGDGSANDGITITNYEMAHKFNSEDFESVVLDESSILKSLDGKTKKLLTKKFKLTKYKLCCTATPAPNDIAEIANHAEFLGIMSRADMLAAFFVHYHGGHKKGAGWSLKGHAEEPFYKWLASWSISVKTPSDIGYSDEGYILPKLNIDPHFVKTSYRPKGSFFHTSLKGITGRSKARKNTLKERCDFTVDLVKKSKGQWIIWCGLNDESDYLSRMIPESKQVYGSQSIEEKINIIEDFQSGKVRILITKPKITGFGMNFQNCHNMAFVGLSDSWESYYQCIRRCYRFGQKKPVSVHIVLSDSETQIFNNVMRKQKEAEKMSKELIKNVANFEKDEIKNHSSDFVYEKDDKKTKNYHLMLGDCIDRVKEIEDNSIGMSVYSPPFLSLYSYSNTERDMGNCSSHKEFYKHYKFLLKELLRITKEGRHTLVHCAPVPATKNTDGFIGTIDFRGELVKQYVEAGWIYHGEIVIDKDPQVQAIRTKAKGLMFVTKNKDSSWCRPAFPDYILIFRKPGENQEHIKNDVTNDEWILWARPIWYGIKETKVLKASEGRHEKDEKHVCPLQLETIERCIRLWSNKGDTIFSPFMGIGSEGFESIRLGRKFIGIELKRSYFNAAMKNLAKATKTKEQKVNTLFGE